MHHQLVPWIGGEFMPSNMWFNHQYFW
uniref:Uncharacterized protein n=1 Tax=Rhizophora mucronata TaxID=61149 RepID=A0A2P2PG91_RHIMU